MAKRDDAIATAKKFLSDLNSALPLLEGDAWEQALDLALLTFSTDYPQRLKVMIEFEADEPDYVLPASFIRIDPVSFNAAVNPDSASASVNPFASDTDSEDSNPLNYSFDGADRFAIESASRNGAFAARTIFEFIDDGAGQKALFVDPVPLAALSATFLYFGLHVIGEVLTGDPPALTDTDTVPVIHRHRLTAKIAEIALMELQRLTAGDAQITMRIEAIRKQAVSIYRRGGRPKRRVNVA